MLTKDQFAHVLIRDFKSEGQEDLSYQVQQRDVLKSSCLAVAMERLGMLEGDMAEYAASRGGTLFVYVETENKVVAILSARDIMELLPE